MQDLEKPKPFHSHHSVHAKIELSPELDPIEEIMAASLLEASNKNLKEGT
jgi:hypothetical protein